MDGREGEVFEKHLHVSKFKAAVVNAQADRYTPQNNLFNILQWTAKQRRVAVPKIRWARKKKLPSSLHAMRQKPCTKYQIRIQNRV